MRRYEVGDEVEDRCRFCNATHAHRVSIADGDGRALRVVCSACGTEHPFGGVQPAPAPLPAPRPAAGPGRGLRGPREAFPLVSERERRFPRMEGGEAAGPDLELVLRRVLREELGVGAAVPAEKWRGGELVLKPGKEGVQDKSWPIETFFHKVVLIRNKLRVLEQQVNAAEDISVETKLKLQGYVTACYGSLTSFNVLFADEEDQFRGASGE